MASVGPNSPGTTAAVNSAFGTLTWSNVGNVVSANSSSADVLMESGEETHYIKVTNFGFAIDAGGTIEGITVEVLKDATTGDITDGASGVFLVKGGTVSGDDKQKNLDSWNNPGTGGYVTYGGAADMWGLTFTPAEINSSDFGFVIGANNGGGGGGYAYVDHIRITIHGTNLEAGGGGSTGAAKLLTLGVG